MKLSFGSKSAVDSLLSFNTLVEPGNKFVVLIGVECCGSVELLFRCTILEEIICSFVSNVKVCTGGIQ